MSQVLSVFHDANDASLRNGWGSVFTEYDKSNCKPHLNLMVSFLFDTIASFSSLLSSFHLGGHSADFDLLHWTCEIIVERK